MSLAGYVIDHKCAGPLLPLLLRLNIYSLIFTLRQ